MYRKCLRNSILPSGRCGVTREIMYINEISTSSYIKRLSERQFRASLESIDGVEKIEHLLNKTVLSGGKHLRPMLTYLSSQLAGLDEEVVHILSQSIEFVHAASLAHDDVIDNAQLRRGKPSINIAGDNKMAILAGDFLLAEVINDLTSLGNLEIVAEMANIIKRLSKGEWLQHDCLKNRNYQIDDFKTISLHKTSSVLEWCFASPFIYKKFSKEIVAQARSLGENLGYSFQLYDDLLDYSDSSEKDKFLDLENGQLTLISFLYLKEHGLMDQYKNGGDLSALIDFSKIHPILENVRIMADQYHEKCLQSFDRLIESINTDHDNNNVLAIKFLLNKLKNRKK